jgi:hypothetical protein
MEIPSMKKRRKQPKTSTRSRTLPLALFWVGVMNATINGARLVWMFFHHGS